jgi:hypothetical protein
MKIKSVLITALAVFALAACGDDDENNATTNNATTNNSTAPTARVQIIHNAADPGAAIVDIYVNDELFLDDVAFRSATPYSDVPAGADLNIGIAPGDSASSDDALATFGPYNLAADSETLIVANGVLAPAEFEANPDGEDTAFGLWVAPAREMAADMTKFEFAVVHGATDAPTVDVSVQGADLTLVDDATYGAITDYIAVDPAAYTLDLTTADGATVVQSYSLDTSAFGGATAVVLASGFLSTGGDDPDTNGFELVYYTAAGGAGTAIPVAE